MGPFEAKPQSKMQHLATCSATEKSFRRKEKYSDIKLAKTALVAIYHFDILIKTARMYIALNACHVECTETT